MTAVGINSQAGIIFMLLGAAADEVENMEKERKKKGGLYVLIISIYRPIVMFFKKQKIQESLNYVGHIMIIRYFCQNYLII